MKHWSVNEAAADILEREVIPKADRLNIGVTHLKNGATVLDMGIHCKGGFRAGKYFAEVGMGGLGRLSFAMIPLKNYTVPGLRVFTENPGVCEMASYVAATRVPWRGDLQVISGPVRSILGSDQFAQSVDYRDVAPRKAGGRRADHRFYPMKSWPRALGGCAVLRRRSSISWLPGRDAW